ncbi:MAG: hypothetical protein QGH37_30465 [Candidatus Poribacteria bacterium]|nr:hypothetical protein [Candidatus Poribacteria bacterium]MDP6997857.1 hypothetical protein [Candidatus Poribacteria bacterium]
MIGRSHLYCPPRLVLEPDLRRRHQMIDWYHLEIPFAGARMLHHLLKLDGVKNGNRGAISPAQY